MTVAIDAFSASSSGTGTLSWTHTPSGTPRGVLILASGVAGSDEFAAATYGGVAVPEMAGSPNVLSTGETGNVSAFFLGSSVPAGAQTAEVTVNGVGSKRAYCVTLTAADDTRVEDYEEISSTSQLDPSVTLSLGGRACACALVFYSGVNAVGSATPFANWTSRAEGSTGTETVGCYTYDIVASSDVTAGWTQAADDACAICVALTEVTRGYVAGSLAGAGSLSAVVTRVPCVAVEVLPGTRLVPYAVVQTHDTAHTVTTDYPRGEVATDPQAQSVEVI